MTRPRKEQVQNLKTKHTFMDPKVIGIPSYQAYPVQDSSSTVLSATTTFLNNTVTQIFDGAQESLPAKIVAPNAGPYTISVGSILNITIPGVNGGLPIPVTFQASDIIQISSLPRMTPAKAANRINTVLMGAPYSLTAPVASVKDGNYLVITGISTGDSDQITISDNTVGILAQLGFGSTASITANGITAPKRGVLTRSLDLKGGNLPIRYANGATVFTQISRLVHVGNANLVGNTIPGREIYLRASTNPLVANTLYINSFADTCNAIPEIITSGGDFANPSLDAGSIIVTLGGFIGFSVTFGSGYTSRQDVINAINVAYNGYFSSLPLPGKATVLSVNRVSEPFSLNSSDNIQMSINGGAYFTISFTGTERTVADVVARINADPHHFSPYALASVYINMNGPSLMLQTLLANGSASTISIIGSGSGIGPATHLGSYSNIQTLEKLGLTVGTYSGSEVALPYGAAEIKLQNPAAADASGLYTIAVTANNATTAALLGIPWPGGTPVSSVVGENAALMPLIQDDIRYLVPEVMEFGEVPDNIDDVEQKFLTPNPVTAPRPEIGIRNKGQVPGFGDDGKIDSRYIQSYFETLGVGNLNLGAYLQHNTSLGDSPRILAPFSTNVAVPYTLLWESTDVPASSAIPSVRFYASRSGDFLIVNGARWDNSTSLWYSDTSSVAANQLRFTISGIRTFVNAAGPSWADTAWTESPFETNYSTAGGDWASPNNSLTVFGNKGLANQSAAGIARIGVPYSVAAGVKTLVYQSSPAAAGTAPISRTYVSSISGTTHIVEHTVNAWWDGTYWNRDFYGTASRIKTYHTANDPTFTNELGPSGYERSYQIFPATQWTDSGWSYIAESIVDGDGTVGLLPVFGTKHQIRGTLTLGTVTGTAYGGINEQVPRLVFGNISNRMTLLYTLDRSSSGYGIQRFYFNDINTMTGTYFVTLNARWDSSTNLWYQDTPSSSSGKYMCTGDMSQWQTKNVAGVGPASWSDSNWDSIITVKSNLFEGPLAPPRANTLYPENTPKAWATIVLNTASVPTLADSFNIDSVVRLAGSPGLLEVTFKTAMANSNYTIMTSMDYLLAQGAEIGTVAGNSNGYTTHFDLYCKGALDNADKDPNTLNGKIFITIFGRQ